MVVKYNNTNLIFCTCKGDEMPLKTFTFTNLCRLKQFNSY